MDTKHKLYIIAGFAAVFLIALMIGFALRGEVEQDQIVHISYNDQEQAILNSKVNAPSIVFNNVTLFDSTVFNITSNTCTGSRYGMNIKINPCAVQDVDGKEITQYVNFTWSGGSVQDTDWVFVYDGVLESGKMEVYEQRMAYWNESVIENKWISNYQVTNVAAMQSLGTPDQRCQIGNSNNTQMYNVTRTFANGTTIYQTYCFTNVQNQGGGTYAISGNYYDNYIAERSGLQWNWYDVTNQIDFIGFGLLNDERSYYKVRNVNFAPNQTIATKWTYAGQDNSKRGKWHILGYDSSTGLVQSIVNDQYIYLDPWWNNNWAYKKQVTNLTGNIISLMIPYNANMQSDYDDVRFVNSGETAELPYARIYYNSTSAVYKVQTNQSASLYMYYGNPAASYTGDLVGVYHPNLKGAWFFENPSNVGENSYNASNNYSVTTDVGWVAYRNSSFGAAQSVGASAQLRGNYLTTPPTAFTFMGFGKINATGGTYAAFGDISYTNKVIDRQDPNFRYVVGRGGGTNIEVTKNADSNYHFFVGTVVNSGNLNFYIDTAASPASASLGGSMGASVNELTLMNHDPSYAGAGSFMKGMVDDFIYLDTNINSSQVTYFSYQTAPYAVYGTEETAQGLSISLDFPANAQNFNVLEVYFNSTLTPTAVNNSNATIRVYNSSNFLVFNQTNIVLGNSSNTTNWTNTFSSSGTYTWNVYGCGTDGSTSICSTSSNQTFVLDVDPPNVVINNPTANQVFITDTLPYNVTVNVTSTDPSLQTCWYGFNGVNTTYTCNTNFNVSLSSHGNYTIFAYANDSAGGLSFDSENFALVYYSVDESEDPVAEGGTATFGLNINMTNIPSTAAYFRYNNTNYAPTTQVNTQNSSRFTYDLNIPVGWGNSTGRTQYWNWTFNISNIVSNYNTTTQTQSVFSVLLTDCSTGGTVILNFTHRDENTKNLINFSNGNNLQVDLTLTSLADSSIQFFYNGTEIDKQNIAVCIGNNVLNGTSFKLDLTGSYVATDYVQEFYFMDNASVTNSNSPQNINWYDLPTDDSTTFLFTFLDEDSIEVPDAVVEVFRQYIGDGQFLEVERGKQDNNGQTHLHLVEEDVIYFFNITLNGQHIFTSTTYNAKCLSTPCEIELEAGTEFEDFPTDWQLLDGGGYAFGDNATSRTVSLVFSLNSPSLMNLTVAKQDYTGGLEIIDTDVTTATSGTLSVVVPQAAGNVTYYAILYRDGEYVSNEIVDFSPTASAYYSTTGNVMASLLIIALILMGATEGVLLFIFIILSFILVGALALLKLGYYAIVGFICFVGIIVWKLIKRGRRYE